MATMTPQQMKTHDRARDCLARLMREFNKQEKEERDVQGFRALVYAFQVLLQFFRLEHDMKVEGEIDKIWEVLNGKKDIGSVA